MMTPDMVFGMLEEAIVRYEGRNWAARADFRALDLEALCINR